MKEQLESMVLQYGIKIVIEALLELASGESIGDIIEQVQRRAIRLAADAEAKAVLE